MYNFEKGFKSHRLSHLRLRRFGTAIAISLVTPAATAITLQRGGGAKRCYMKLPLKLGAILAVLFFLSAVPAKADSAPSDTMTYTLSGSTTASFTISMDSGPDWSDNGTAFTMDPLNLMVDGTSMTDTVVFFNSSEHGGLNGVFSCLPDLIGPQLYTGSESDPTFLTGVFQLFDIETGASYTLTVTESSSMPEPSTILMLVSGLFAVGLGFRRRSSNPADVN